MFNNNKIAELEYNIRELQDEIFKGIDRKPGSYPRYSRMLGFTGLWGTIKRISDTQREIRDDIRQIHEYLGVQRQDEKQCAKLVKKSRKRGPN